MQFADKTSVQGVDCSCPCLVVIAVVVGGGTTRTSSERLCDVSELDYVERDGLLVADLQVPGCQARVIKYEAGSAIPLHRHSGRSVKVLLRGAIVFATARGDVVEASTGDIYPCTGIPYRGEVVRDSYLLAIDELRSERILVDDASAGTDAGDRATDMAGELVGTPGALRRRASQPG